MWSLLCLSVVALAGAANPLFHVQNGTGGEYLDPHCGGRQVIVQLFEWKWTDVAAECERFLGPKGFCGVQVSPPNEHVELFTPPAPWWERYQPVSYNLTSRSGTEAQFVDMVNRCKTVGVRIYADAVLNNMAGITLYGKGSGGSSFNSDFRDFGAVPYGSSDFNAPAKCPSTDNLVNDYNNPDEVRNCSYIGWTDLDQSRDHVRKMVSGYLNHLIQLGVAGFRIALAKYMWPQDLEVIEGMLQDLPEGGRPFIFHHVQDYGDDAIKTSEYTPFGYVTEFRYSAALADAIRKGLDNLHGVQGHGHGITPSDHALVFVDNHETQRTQLSAGVTQLNFQEPDLYAMATAFTLAYDYGLVRVMSSYSFTDNDAGPPSHSDYSTKDVPILPDGSCGDGWVCEHRWPEIANMVRFRNEVAGTDVNHWVDQPDFVAFSRGGVGFFGMTSQQNGSFQKDVKTGLPAGHYCDVITICNRTFTVDNHGNVKVDLDLNSESNIFALLRSWPAPTDEGASFTIQPTSATSMQGSAEQTAQTTHSSNVMIVFTTESYLMNSNGWELSSVGQNSGQSSHLYGHSSYAPVAASVYNWAETSFGPGFASSRTHSPSETLLMSSIDHHGIESSHAAAASSHHHVLMSSGYLLQSSEYTLSSNEYESSSVPYPSRQYGSTYVPYHESSSVPYPYGQYESSYMSKSWHYESSSMPYWWHYESSSLPYSWNYDSSYMPYSSQKDYSSHYHPQPSSSGYVYYSSSFEPYLPSSEYFPPSSTYMPATPSTSPTTTQSPYRRTIILQHYQTGSNDYIFFRGGAYGADCNGEEAHSNPCAVPIRDRDEGSYTHLYAYNAWRQGDNFLDWHGKEDGQGYFPPMGDALGTPGIWTSDKPDRDGYSVINRYGDHYWLLDVEMDCSRLTQSQNYFEFKAFSKVSGWEKDLQPHSCTGSGAYPGPSGTSVNHFARCGYVNVFKADGSCEILTLDEAGVTGNDHLVGSVGNGGVPVVG